MTTPARTTGAHSGMNTIQSELEWANRFHSHHSMSGSEQTLMQLVGGLPHIISTRTGP